MKKIVYFLLFALCLPIGMMAQGVNDDLYFIPSKDKKVSTPVKKEQKKQAWSPWGTPWWQEQKSRGR